MKPEKLRIYNKNVKEIKNIQGWDIYQIDQYCFQAFGELNIYPSNSKWYHPKSGKKGYYIAGKLQEFLDYGICTISK